MKRLPKYTPAEVRNDPYGFTYKEMSEFFDDVITKTGYMASLELDKETCDERKANVMELLANLLHYMEDNDDATLTGFLEEVALMTDIDNYNSESDSAVMMTLHSAKGLEFPVVFIVGMEEGLFPGNQVMYDESEVEEERRLCYVGITRAKEKLYITNARSRMIFGNTSFTRPSRFIGEIPPELTDSDLEKRSGYNSFWGADLNDYAPAAPYSQRKKTADSTAFAQKKSSYSPPERNKGFSRGFSGKGAGSTTATGTVDLKAGDRVLHKAFGEGMVISAKPMGGDLLLEVAFDNVGTKKLMAKMARLTKL